MPADLTKPFAESCCDGGECSITKQSARSCGCDPGANYRCLNHSLVTFSTEEVHQLKNLLEEGLSMAQDLHTNTIWWEELNNLLEVKIKETSK